LGQRSRKASRIIFVLTGCNLTFYEDRVDAAIDHVGALLNRNCSFASSQAARWSPRSRRPNGGSRADGPLTIVTRDHAKRLLEAVADERLTFEVANYTADCIIMSDDFQFADGAVNEAIYFVEDDSIAPTVEEVRTAIERLAH